ncbi:hypothetical protein EJ04DRAFT_530189 [Polyplosphaeria fusca]|uniref:Uncharacterized protein n=1 Tax=Polyplosphaeria fusca TaxID=682080 RepID=A0A9P4UV97_9PLEO|nr:hypothetical protein EJ04DRAFT_530189 [Polyplosphaeria fusca]
MRSFFYIVLTLCQFCVASRCLVFEVDNGSLMQVLIRLKNDRVVDGRTPLKVAMRQAVELADNAFDVMNDHASDDRVQSMCKLVLGDTDFQNKFDTVKGTFRRLKAFDKTPTELAADGDAWRQMRTNNDVAIFDWYKLKEFYANADRFVMSDDGVVLDTLMGNKKWPKQHKDKLNRYYSLEYDLDNPEDVSKRTKAFSLSSTFINIRLWMQVVDGQHPNLPRNRKDPIYWVPNPNWANSIDVCTWFIDEGDRAEWPQLNEAQVKIVSSQEFVEAYVAGNPDKRTTIAALKTLSVTLLHELTHTVPGGELEDVNGGDCYGWKCTQQLHDVNNADNITMLAIALKLWSLGYWADSDVGIVWRCATKLSASKKLFSQLGYEIWLLYTLQPSSFTPKLRTMSGIVSLPIHVKSHEEVETDKQQSLEPVPQEDESEKPEGTPPEHKEQETTLTGRIATDMVGRSLLEEDMAGAIPRINWNVQTSAEFEDIGFHDLRKHFETLIRSGSEKDAFNARRRVFLVVDEDILQEVDEELQQGQPLNAFPEDMGPSIWLFNAEDDFEEELVPIHMLVRAHYQLDGDFEWKMVMDDVTYF